MAKPGDLKILIIDDDSLMADCISRAIRPFKSEIHSNAITAINALDPPPDLIFLDILLDGPDGFTFLNELASYSETSNIPVVVVTSLNLKNQDLSIYGVVEILSKDTMTPSDLRRCIEKYVEGNNDA